jgi:ribonuclease-3
MQLGAGMRAGGGTENTSVLADAFEAFVGALYLRFGIEKTREFVAAQHIERLDHSAEELLDAKTRLQHYAQEHLAATPVYRETNRGTPQRPAFKSRVSVRGKVLGRGEGPSKKAAQQAAAQAALLAVMASTAATGRVQQ